MAVIIRDAEDRDYKQAAILYAQPALMYPQTGIFTGTEQFKASFDPQSLLTPELFKHYRNGQKGFGLFVAEKDGELVGICCHINEPLRDSGTSEQLEMQYIEILAVDEKYRGQGIGSLLLNEFERRAKLQGFNTVSLDVMKHNVGAVELYNKKGYETVITIQDRLLDKKAPDKTASGLSITFAKAADWPSFQAFQAAMAMPASKTLLRFFDESTKGKIRDRNHFEQMLKSNQILMASNQNGLAGYAEFEAQTSDSADREPKTLCILHRLVARQPEIMKALLEQTINHSHALGYKGVRAFSMAADHDRENLLASAQFKPFRLYMAKSI